MAPLGTENHAHDGQPHHSEAGLLAEADFLDEAELPAEPRNLPAEQELSALGLGALILTTFWVVYSFASVTIALPNIQTDLHTSASATQWVLAAYGLTVGTLLILGGRLGDHYGRTRLTAIGLTIGVLTAASAAHAPNIEVLIGLRALQGVGAAMSLPQVLATIQATTSGQHRARAVSTFSAAAGAGAAVGQVCGGLLVSSFGWPAVLWSSAALGALGLVGLRSVPATRSEHQTSIDPVGVVLLALGLTLFIVPITLAPKQGPIWLLLFILSAGAFALFWRHENRYTGTPLIPPAVLLRAPVAAGLGTTALFFTIFGGFSFLITIVTQQGFGYPAWKSGLAFVPFSMAFLITSLLAAKLAQRFGPMRLAQTGLAGNAVCLVLLTAVLILGWPAPNLWLLEVPLILIGAMSGLVYAPLAGLIMKHVPLDLAGLTGGILATTQQVMVAVGISAFGAALPSAPSSVGFKASVGLCLVVTAVASLLVTKTEE